MANAKGWFRAALIRAIRTLVQAAASAAIVAIGSATTVGEVDWRLVAGTAGLAAILSLLTSLTGLPEVKQAATDGEIVVNMTNPEEETVQLIFNDKQALEKEGKLTFEVRKE